MQKPAMRIVSGKISAVRAAPKEPSRLEIRVNGVWCSAPAVTEDGDALPIGESHLRAARAYFLGRQVEIQIDADGTIRAHALWKRDDEP